MSIERIGAQATGTGGQSLPFCQATVANGFVFVSGQVAMAGSTNGTVHAFDAGTGSSVWTQGFQIKGDGQSSVYGGGAAFADGRAVSLPRESLDAVCPR